MTTDLRFSTVVLSQFRRMNVGQERIEFIELMRFIWILVTSQSTKMEFCE